VDRAAHKILTWDVVKIWRRAGAPVYFALDAEAEQAPDYYLQAGSPTKKGSTFTAEATCPDRRLKIPITRKSDDRGERFEAAAPTHVVVR
jgi:hypothetical protein